MLSKLQVNMLKIIVIFLVFATSLYFTEAALYSEDNRGVVSGEFASNRMIVSPQQKPDNSSNSQLSKRGRLYRRRQSN
ncbi:hypothetical protein HPULCUR_006940 [Helicostylum pulchrum]|uniref:Uncharacterized protein n=1 Tax=Helicostylum pulchrum TaxID=562976 RepID=A0ABP9Y3C9_9FUNG